MVHYEKLKTTNQLEFPPLLKCLRKLRMYLHAKASKVLKLFKLFNYKLVEYDPHISPIFYMCRKYVLNFAPFLE